MQDGVRRQKAAIRRALRQEREALPPAERERRSRAAVERLAALPEWAAARTVMAYWPIKGEVDTRPLLHRALAAGKRVALPRVVTWAPGDAPPPPGVHGAGGRGLAIHLYTGRPEELAAGPFGLTEPRPDTPVLSRAELDLVVVPGVAFDRAGHRIGYGGGYYDRFLVLLPARTVRIGIAYGFQLLGSVPAAPGDQGVDLVVTDTEVVRVRRS